MRYSLIIFIISICFSCESTEDPQGEKWENAKEETSDTPFEIERITGTGPSLVVLGTCQDGGSPQINCHEDCCKNLNPDLGKRKVVSLGLVVPEKSQTFMFDATPDFPSQIVHLSQAAGFKKDDIPDGIFLTHAHMGHYTGLMYLGKEALDAKDVDVFAMPRMKTFLETNGPWDMLVKRENIVLHEIYDSSNAYIADVTVHPFLVPHRDEYSETVGYHIQGPNKTALFIPDIDKWEKWETPLEEALSEVDYAFIDATFYDEKELPGRDMSEIPHPFVVETMERLQDMPESERSKIIFIHINHTNKLLDPESEEYKTVNSNGFRVAKLGDVFEL